MIPSKPSPSPSLAQAKSHTHLNQDWRRHHPTRPAQPGASDSMQQRRDNMGDGVGTPPPWTRATRGYLLPPPLYPISAATEKDEGPCLPLGSRHAATIDKSSDNGYNRHALVCLGGWRYPFPRAPKKDNAGVTREGRVEGEVRGTTVRAC